MFTKTKFQPVFKTKESITNGKQNPKYIPIGSCRSLKRCEKEIEKIRSTLRKYGKNILVGFSKPCKHHQTVANEMVDVILFLKNALVLDNNKCNKHVLYCLILLGAACILNLSIDKLAVAYVIKNAVIEPDLRRMIDDTWLTNVIYQIHTRNGGSPGSVKSLNFGGGNPL